MQTITIRNKKIIKLRSKGLSYSSIASLFDISKQRIYQICQGYLQLPQGEEMNKLREEIFERDNYECQWKSICDKMDVPKKYLIIHHINFNRQDNNPKNLITLCTKCHSRFHGQNWTEDNKNTL